MSISRPGEAGWWVSWQSWLQSDIMFQKAKMKMKINKNNDKNDDDDDNNDDDDDKSLWNQKRA